MKTIILVCRIDGSLDRGDLEMIEGAEYTQREFDDWMSGKDGVSAYTLSEFQDAWNNEEISESEHWVGYVYVK